MACASDHTPLHLAHRLPRPGALLLLLLASTLPPVCGAGTCAMQAALGGGGGAPCVEGCRSPAAANYDSTATADDGSCRIPGCTDSSSPDYEPVTLPHPKPDPDPGPGPYLGAHC